MVAHSHSRAKLMDNADKEIRDQATAARALELIRQQAQEVRRDQEQRKKIPPAK